MTKSAAIYQFWAGFGLPAYEENAVPTGEDAPAFPYITYQLITDDFGNDVALTASAWYRGSSWVNANAKAEEIGAAIGRGGTMLSCDNGAIWLKKGSPFAQRTGDESDTLIKRIYFNISAEFLTAD